LYPMVPGVAGFSINTPQFENIKISLSKGVLEIKGGSATIAYITSIKVNGRKHTSSWIDWKSIHQGGYIEYKIESKPN